MEVLYSTYDEETTRKANELAERFGLLKSGGKRFPRNEKEEYFARDRIWNAGCTLFRMRGP